MKKNSLLVLAVIMHFATYSQQLNLMPWPSDIKMGQGKFIINKNLRIRVDGQPDARFQPNLVRFIQQLSKRSTIPFDRDSVITTSEASMIIKVNRKGVVKLGEDEAYSLQVTEKSILLTAETELGAMHGLQTLLQLLGRNSDSFFFPSVTINDKPRFVWRGLMIDACRHFIPLEVVKHNIDAMAAVKMNVLHWHLSEDQGFRVESKVFPKLHQLGSNGDFYTQVQIKEVIAYANERGIRVMPEFDIPGHASAWMVGHPELASAPGNYKIEKFFGVFDPTIDPTLKETYKFFEKFFKEMAQLFPDDYMHIGGDENNGVQWDKNLKIQEFMKKNGIKSNHELQAYFNRNLLKILEKNGKKMIGWDEIFQPTLPKTIVIHSWRGRESMEEAARKGYQSVLSNGYYIDLFHNCAEHYLNDPLPADSKLTDEEKSRILGGEATMWAELVIGESVDTRIWPRTAAIAERFWSPASVNNIDDMYRRLDAISLLLEETGIGHIKNREAMMRRLCNSYNIEPLKVLVDAVEPLEGYDRHGSQRYTTEYPLTRVADVALSDAPDFIRFRLSYNSYLKDNNRESYNMMMEYLDKWVNNHQSFSNLASSNVVLKEALPLSNNLAEIASITRKLLIQYTSGIKNGAAETNGLRIQLESLNKPVAEMELPLFKVALDLIGKLRNGEKDE